MTGNQFLTLTEIANTTGIDRSTVHRRIKKLGIEPAMVAGKTRLFATADVERIMAGTDA